MNRNLIIAIVAVVVLGGGAFILFGFKGGRVNVANCTAGDTITYSDSGFSPSCVKIKSGETLSITNNSEQNVEVASDPHPTHTNCTWLNTGVSLETGKSISKATPEPQSCRYHNHLNPNHGGAVVVE